MTKIIHYALICLVGVITVILTLPIFVFLSPVWYVWGEIPDRFLKIRDFIPDKTIPVIKKLFPIQEAR